MRLLYPLAKRFIAGQSLDAAKKSIDKLISDGYEVTVDYIGEDSKTVPDCDKAFSQYVEIIKSYKGKKIDVSIKPSQLGIKIHPLISRTLLSRLAELAKTSETTIRLDMEDSSVTSLTLNQAIFLNERYGNVGVAIQANLLRSAEDIKALAKSGVSVRLVKGAYKENEETAYQSELGIESSFFNIAANLYQSRANRPAIATHDESLLEDIECMLPDAKYFDYEFLYGIRRDLQKEMKDKGYRVRIYVPFGENWLPYTLRRLKEWKNLKFVVFNMIRELFRRSQR
jgi:proline dehydrogenase